MATSSEPEAPQHLIDYSKDEDVTQNGAVSDVQAFTKGCADDKVVGELFEVIYGSQVDLYLFLYQPMTLIAELVTRISISMRASFESRPKAVIYLSSNTFTPVQLAATDAPARRGEMTSQRTS